VENASFCWREIARYFWATGVFLGGKSHDHRRFEKEVYLAKRFFDSTKVVFLRKKHLISINGKKTLNRIVVEGEKLKLRKLPSKELIALFSSRRRACPVLKHNRVSEVLKDFEYYGQRNYVLKWKFYLCH